MRPHSTLDPSFVASVKRLFNQKGCSFLDIDMTQRLDWRFRRHATSASFSSTSTSSSSSHSQSKSFLDEPASVPPCAELVIGCSELRHLCPDAPEELYTFRVRSAQRGRPVTVRDVLSHLDRFLYDEIPASYWPEQPTQQERIECAHRLRVRHLARTHGRALTPGHGNTGRRRTLSMSLSPSYSPSSSYSTNASNSNTHSNSHFGSGSGGSISGSHNHSRKQSTHGGVGLGLTVGTLPLPFMQVVECAETDADGRVVRRDRKVAPRIDWLGGKFFFAGLKRCLGDGEVDFEVIMEGPWARTRKGVM